MLPEEQITQIKQQLIQQINSTFPDDKKESAKQQISSMNSKQLEEFLIKNNLVRAGGRFRETGSQPERAGSRVGGPGLQGQAPQCIFCSIISNKIPSYKIDENKDSIAILEINPISKAHTIIIPKEHISSSDKIPKTAFTLAKKIAKKIKTKFKPKDITIASTNLFGHEIINILPVYENETLESEKHQAKPEELEELKKSLEPKPKNKTIKPQKIKKLKPKKIWFPTRIP